MTVEMSACVRSGLFLFYNRFQHHCIPLYVGNSCGGLGHGRGCGGQSAGAACGGRIRGTVLVDQNDNITLEIDNLFGDRVKNDRCSGCRCVRG